ncbi:MAG: hypothetical protein HFE48_05660 [Clostridia bacterium]|nr:hypothetical protein [Clostridia bacterium]
MKKKIALPVIITSACIAAVLVAVLVLSLISVNPMTSLLGGYRDVVVYKPGETSAQPMTEKAREALDKEIKGTEFSVMHAILEGRFAYGVKFQTQENDKGEKERVTLNPAAILLLEHTQKENYILEFRFAEVKTVKVQGEEVEFDCAKAVIFDTNGEIEKISVYPYLYSKVTVLDDEHYRAPALEIWSTTSSLCALLNDYDSLIR